MVGRNNKGKALRDWEKKLIPGARQMLTAVNEKLEFIQERFRQAIAAEDVEKATFTTLDWTDDYRQVDIDSKKELLQTFSRAYVEPEMATEIAAEFNEAVTSFMSDREEAFLSTMAFLHAGLFILNGLEHPEILLGKIRRGDDKALFDFARVDKTIIGHRYVQKRIRIAQISGDVEFFRKLATALRYDPRNRSFKLSRRDWMMRLIAQLAIETLTMNEVCQILQEVCGIYIEDVETVRKAWNRAGLGEIAPKRHRRRKTKRETGQK